MPDAISGCIDAATRYCAVFGSPIRHSASPSMQNAGIEALGLNWRYLAFEVHPDHLEAALQGAKRMGFVGVNLTVPHKLLALGWVDELDESARRWGAVNTIRFEGRNAEGIWKPLGVGDEPPVEIRSNGFNTDADAIVRSLREDLGFEVRGRRILLLGAGGAGRVAALRLAQEEPGALFLVNRTAEKAAAVAAEIIATSPTLCLEVGYPADHVDLVLNATSLGLKPGDGLPFDPRRFSFAQATAAYDMIYRPAETPFLKAAKTAGCRTANGIGMLLYQGTKALEIWTKREAPVEVMRRALMRNIYGL